MADLKSAKLELWVYGGDVTNVPENPNYTLTKKILTGHTVIPFEISELVRDHVTVEFDGNYANIKQTKWVKYKVTRTYTDDTTDNYEKYLIAFRGYGEFDDGLNPELSRDIMISNRVIHTLCGYDINLPMFVLEDGVSKVTYTQDDATTDSLLLGSAATVTSDSTGVTADSTTLTADVTAQRTTDPDSGISELSLPNNTESITITKADGSTEIIKIKCLEECKHKPYKISFVNKFGVIQDMWFFKKRVDSFTTERDEYKKSIMKVKDSISFSSSSHKSSYLKNQGKELFTMNTGFIDEGYGEVIKQLMVSEYVYIHDLDRINPLDNSTKVYAIKVASSDVDIKTRLNDKLINYTLQFEAASEFIQSIR